MAINKMRDQIDPMEGDDMMSAPRRKADISGVLKMIITLVVALVIIAGLGKLCWMGYNAFNSDPIANVSSSDWQAVFLVNGQVYFGKVKALGSKTLTLNDIYYLQVVTKPLQQTQQGTAAAATDQQNQELTLIKLGSEIHGPSDRMVINRDQIILTEKLKTDSRVVQAILKYVSDQKKAAATPATK